MQKNSQPSIHDVLEQELQQVEASRNLRLDNDGSRRKASDSLVGLAFSGGGIRSATFNLGVLQAFARKGLLRSVDYLSTVSGGGYIGGWLMGWMYHQNIGIRDVEKRLSAPPGVPAQANDLPEVHFLRDFSNYLTPRKGVLRADFLAFAACYLRNTLLNQVILILTLLGLLMIPRTLVYVVQQLEKFNVASPSGSSWLQDFAQSYNLAMVLALIFGVIAVTFMGLNLESVDPRHGKRDYFSSTPQGVHLLILIPLMASAGSFAYSCSRVLIQWRIIGGPVYRALIMGFVMYFGMWLPACVARIVARRFRGTVAKGSPSCKLLLLTAAITSVMVAFLLNPYARLLIYDFDEGKRYSDWHVMIYGPPAVIGIMLLAGVLHIGLMGRGMTEAYREWWGRLGGLLALYALGWLAVFLIAIYFPYGWGQLIKWEGQPSHAFSIAGIQIHPIPAGSILTWIISTAYGVFFGKSEKTSGWNPKAPVSKQILSIAARLTPMVFILGLLLMLSVVASFLVNRTIGLHGTFAKPIAENFNFYVPALFIIFIGAALLLSLRVDINEFSTHYLYRNRLVRCYLGATVPKRDAQPFTGFSEVDNFPLADLKVPVNSADPKDGRPIPILNTSLNVVRGKELALQSRKARSFTLTPLHGGFTRASRCTREWQAFYAPTEKLACKLPGFKDGVTLGTAIAISGAAASPNMGFYSDAALAFLMTLFDVRLGWWIGNPRGDTWQNGSPKLGFLCLLKELLGLASDESDYVYLSDGGHFENLAVYELVRRRCRVIIASDASCDPGYALGDLHNAIERCRTDFGVEIVMHHVDELEPKPAGESGGIGRCESHFITGTIRYNPDSPEQDGVLIYLKPALLDEDPCDILGYATKNQSFPHDTTANQWFDEAHFENYRALGFATGAAASEVVATEICHALAEPAGGAGVEAAEHRALHTA